MITLGEKEGKSTLFHEGQHAIQEREGFARGGSPAQFKYESAGEGFYPSAEELTQAKDLVRWSGQYGETVDAMAELTGTATPRAQHLARNPDLLKEADDAFWNSRNPERAYRNLAGEWEARNAGTRAILQTDDPRLGQQIMEAETAFRGGNPFGTADDIALDDMIVRMEGGGSSKSIEKVPSYWNDYEDFNVAVNPTKSQLKGLFKKAENAKEGRRGGGGHLRYSYDRDGNLYAWDAWEGQHPDVGKHFGFDSVNFGYLETPEQIETVLGK
jgi:hypothetical protein